MDFACDGRDYLKALRGEGTLAYSPLFLNPTLHIARMMPLWLVVGLFGLAYCGGWLIQLWAGMQCATPEERRILRYAAPVLTFFPGLLISDVIAAGNLAYILYGIVLLAMVVGWRRQNWTWFYLAILAVACVKIHLLTMLAIPVLCAKRQWWRAVATGVAGVALYAVQPLLWPQQFQAYAHTLQGMSHSRRDFGCAPVGNLARVLHLMQMPYDVLCLVFYLVFAAGLFGLLFWLSRLYREGRIRFESWAPVMLIGVILLDPRVQSYDIAAISLPMALLALRMLRGQDGKLWHPLVWGAGAAWLVLNIVQEVNEDVVTVLPDSWKYLEMAILLGVFASGVRMLLAEAAVERPSLVVPLARELRSRAQSLEDFDPRKEVPSMAD
ncbi:MAG: hypothetical protein P4M01_10830 [Acidobacteriota bacterium]|nr:hypothetical protein [Acidobacteriota bacterium]